MFHHILVPLDGSKLAEAALPAAVLMAQSFSARITLFHVIEQDAPGEIHGEHHLTNQVEAREYLNHLAATLPGTLNVDSHVHVEECTDVARSIVDHSGELNPDLIVMCSHGRGGLKRMVTGSIAHQVIGIGKVPILLVQPDQPSTLVPDFRNILLPLDLAARHLVVLEDAGELARKLNASLHLLTVVPTYGTLSGKQAASSRLLPGTASVMLEMDEIGAGEQLQELAGSGEMIGLHLRLEVRRGDPASEISHAAADAGDGLIILGTHGKAGMDAFWAGSVAPKVASQTTLPLLLVHVKKEK